MFVGLLGPVEVDGVAPGGLEARERRVLAVLALEPGSVISHGELERYLWEGDDAPPTARKVIQNAVSAIRRQLGQDVVRTAENGYVLDVSEADVDARCFEREAERGRTLLAEGKAWAAADMLVAALDRWRGRALPELRETSAGAAAGRELDEAKLVAEEDLVDARLACGHHTELAGPLRDAVDAEPLRERRWAQLMLALYRSGRQAEALHAYAELSEYLREELGVPPSEELRTLEESIVLGTAEPGIAASRPALDEDNFELTNNIPKGVSSFIGREAEMARIVATFAEHRLVTIAGPGGCGKTRLALETATRLVDTGKHIWLVDLSSLRSPNVSSAIAQVLGVHEAPPRPLIESLARGIHERHLILIVDNCEHVIDESARTIEALLRACPNLRVLATSREPLSISGEYVDRIQPLSLPDRSSTDPEQLLHFEAVRLFVDRASAHSPGFVLDAESSPAVTSICERLDGIPLAIELAAARTRSFSVAEVERRLSDRFALLTGSPRTAMARQRTLEAAVDWSWELLGERERGVLATLSVFLGSFSLDAAVAVCESRDLTSIDAANAVAGLVDRSLVQLEASGSESRYRLLETIRDYAAHRLAQSGVDGVREVRDRHQAYYTTRWPREELRWVHTSLSYDDVASRSARFEEDRDDVLAAVRHGIATRPLSDASLALALNVCFRLYGTGEITLRISLLEEAMAASSELNDGWLRCLGLLLLSGSRMATGDTEGSDTAVRSALPLAEALDDAALNVDVVWLVAYAAYLRDDVPSVLELVPRLTGLIETSSDLEAVAYARFCRSILVNALDPTTSRADLDFALDYYESTGATLASRVAAGGGWLLAQLGDLPASEDLLRLELGRQRWRNEIEHFNQLLHLASVLALRGKRGAAAELVLEAIALYKSLEAQGIAADAPAVAATVLSECGDLETAAQLHGSVVAISSKLGGALDPAERFLMSADEARLRNALGVSRYEELELAGRQWSLERTMEIAAEALRAFT